jgi:putative SOS response-associated peptidase YedK
MASTVTPEAERLAEELVKTLSEDPLTPRQLATELTGEQASAALIGAFDAALSRTAAADETDQLDEALWGRAPSDRELALVRRVSYATLEDALREALADALTREQAATRLGITPQAVSKWVASGGLIALRRGRVSRLPAWQFYEDGRCLVSSS